MIIANRIEIAKRSGMPEPNSGRVQEGSREHAIPMPDRATTILARISHGACSERPPLLA